MVKTGTIIKISEENLKVLKTHDSEIQDCSYAMSKAAKQGRHAEEKCWDTIYGLYPEYKGYDLHINWKTNEITVRGEKEDI